MKKLTRKELINRLDRLRQTCARYEGAVKSKGEWVNRCVTCSRVYPCNKMQGGHLISRACLPLRWDEKNVSPQCLTEESTLVLADGEIKSIKDIHEGDVVCAFNELSYNKELAKVVSADSFVPDELYKVELEDGSCFYATPDHKVVANGKWTRVDELLQSSVDNDILEV